MIKGILSSGSEGEQVMVENLALAAAWIVACGLVTVIVVVPLPCNVLVVFGIAAGTLAHWSFPGVFRVWLESEGE